MPHTLRIIESSQTPTLAARALSAVRSYFTPPISLKDPALARFFGVGAHTTAGIEVTHENAFTFSAVFDAVNQGSADVGKLPLNLLKRSEGGGSTPYTASKLYRILKYEANPDMGAMVFRRTLQAHAMTGKGGFAEIERDNSGQVTALWPLLPHRVQPFIEVNRLANGLTRSTLRYRIDGGATILESPDVIHLRGLGYDGYMGYDVISLAREAIGLALASEKFAGAFFGNNSNLGGILAADSDLDEDQATALQKRIEDVHKGPDLAWKMLVLGAGFKYFRTGVTPSESQMDDQRSRQVEEVARFFNFPLHKLKNLDRATNNNVEQLDLDYYKSFLLTWLSLWEEELNRKLIPPLENRQQYIKHNANAFLRADVAARSAFYSAMLDRGVFCADDALDLEDMNPQPGGQGKLYLVQGAMVPKDKLSAMVDATIAKSKAKSQPPALPAPPQEDPNRELLAAALERARVAEAAATDAIARAAAATEALAVAVSTGQATADELTARRAEMVSLTAVSEQAQVLAEQRRVEAEAEQRRANDAEAARRDADEARALADAARVAAEGEATREREAREEADRRVAVATQAESDSRASEETIRAAAEVLRVENDTLRADMDALRHAGAVALEAERRQREGSEAQTSALNTTIGKLQTALSAFEDRAAADAIRAAQSDIEFAAMRGQLSGETERSANYEALRRAVDVLEHEREQRQAERLALDADVAVVRAQLDEARADLTRLRQLDAEAMSGLIAAHRGVVVDVMRRMVERETDRARRAHTTPDRLRTWLDTFYEGHADLMRTALLPALRVHLAFVRSSEDPVEATRRLVEAHVQASDRQIRTVLDGDADAFAASLTALMYRWDLERSATIADQLMAVELRYAGSLT